ncbi:MAG: type I 3-dehydroquinate dehydratase, partial [Spirochaetales bacterium]|nr:type I 3-dehydroquinate dehydratase [Spirochaetales bacterium]
MICLSCTADSIDGQLAQIRNCRPDIDLAEIRADLLQFTGSPEGFAEELAAVPGRVDLPLILTVRRQDDGGGWQGSERDRLDLIGRVLNGGAASRKQGSQKEKGAAGGYRYVDLEADLEDQELGEAGIERTGTGTGGILPAEGLSGTPGPQIIRSLHDFDRIPGSIPEVVRKLGRRQGEIPKLAAMPGNAADLLELIRAFRVLKGDFFGRMILIGMGRFGFPARILAGVLGNSWTYASAAGERAAPGHTDPKTLTECYRYRSLSPTTRVFGIMGDPVLHSRSPELHNKGFERLGMDAVYVPFPIDEPEVFHDLAEELDLQGLSVTIPHKLWAAKNFPAEDAVGKIGAANTLIRYERDSRPSGGADNGLEVGSGGQEAARISAGQWFAYNTDRFGLIRPLMKRLGSAEALAGLGATVIGAGGAARAVVYALVQAGVRVLILNRTESRAEALAAELGAQRAGPLG